MPCTRFEGVEQRRRHRYGAVDTAAAFLEALHHQQASGEVDAIDGQRQSLRQTAAGIGQRHAERPHRAVSLLGCAQEGVTLAGSEILARAVSRMQRHAGLRPEHGRGGSSERLRGHGPVSRSW
jgi:hypothetical protein